MRRKSDQRRKSALSLRSRIHASEFLEARYLLTGTVTDIVEDVVEPETATVSFSVVSEATSPEATPVNISRTHEWDDFFVEVWVKSDGSHDVSELSFDFDYETKYMSAIDVQFSDEFGSNQSFTIDDTTGTITGISANTELTDVGLGEESLFARIHFGALPENSDNVLLDHETGSVGPYAANLAASNVDMVLSESHPVDLTVNGVPELDLLPVIYDLNDDQSIGLSDLAMVVNNFGRSADSIADGDAWFADFNKDYSVGLADLTMLVRHFGQSSETNNLTLPRNYPEAWVPNVEIEVDPPVDPPEEPEEIPVPKFELHELPNFDPGVPGQMLPGAGVVFVLLVDNFNFPMNVDVTRLSGTASMSESDGEDDDTHQIILTIHMEDEEALQTEIEVVFEGELIDTLAEWWDFQGFISEYVSQVMVSVQGLVEESL